MKKVRKIILRTVLIVILVISAASWYLNNVFLPEKVKVWIVDALSERTGRRVKLENVSYNVFRGIALKGLTIFENSGETNKKFLTAKEIYFKLPLPPLFARKLIIANLCIQSPELTIIRTKPMDWNFLTILAVKPKASRPKFTTLISRATISEGKISFKDLTKEPEFNARMESINGGISLSLPANINFKLTSTLPRRPIINVQSSGTYNLLSKTLDLKINTTGITLTDYAAYYQEAIPIKVTGGKGDLELAFYLDKDKDIQLTGKALLKQLTLQQEALQTIGDLIISTEVTYKIGEEKSLAYKGDLGFNNFRLKGLPPAENLKNITGKLLFSKETNPSLELTAGYKDAGLKLNARITDPDRMGISFGLSSDKGLEAGGEFIAKAKNVYSTKIKGSYLDSSFDLTVNINNRDLPLLNIQGNVNLELADLKQTAAEYFSQINKLNPKGRLALTAKLDGSWNAWKEWSGTLQAESEELIIKEVRFKNLLIAVEMKDKKVSLDKLSAGLYRGVLTSSGILDLAHTRPFYRLELNLVNIDLAELTKEPALNWQSSSGHINGNLELEGYQKKSGTITGKGWLRVEEAKLWETAVFQGLANILYFPNLQKVLFKNGSANFVVANQEVMTSDLLLKGGGLNLSARGSIDFKGNLDFSITTELAREMAKQSPEFGKIANMIMSGLWNYLIELRLKGTIKEPKYSIIPKFSLKGLIAE